MEFCRIKNDAAEIDIVDWNKLIESTKNLEKMPDTNSIDPLTNEEIIFSSEGKAYYIENSEKVGNINFENGVLLTNAVPISVCEKIAKSLDAKVYEDEFL